MTHSAVPARMVTLLGLLSSAFLLAGLLAQPAAAAGEDDEATRLAAQVDRLTSALVDSDLAKTDAMHRTWDPYYQELWGNTPEARTQTQTEFDSSPAGEALRARISDAARRVEQTRAALAELESGAHNPPTDEEQLEILRARVAHLQTRLDADNAIIAYQQGLGTFVKDAVTGWTDTWVKEPFYEFAQSYAGPFLNKMYDELVSEAQSRAVDLAVNQKLKSLNPGIGAEQAAKGYSKLIKMAIKSGMNVEMRVLFQKRLNELAAASGVDPIPGDVSSLMFDYYILAKAQASLEKDTDAQSKWRDKILKSVLKKELKDRIGDWAKSIGGKEAEQQYLDEFADVWKSAMKEAHPHVPASADTPEARERFLAAARERVKAYMESRKGVYAGEIRKKLTEEMNRALETFTEDPKQLGDGLSWLDTADFAVNDVAVPIITVWMNGSDFEAIVENELQKYHIVNEFVKRKTNRRMDLALFQEWYPRYQEIARYRDQWDLIVQVQGLDIPERLDLPFLVTLRYTVRGVSALSEMMMHWTLDRPDGSRIEWDGRTTFADEYELETAHAQPALWEWLLTPYEVKAPGLYTVGVTVEPNYAPLGENPIAGPKLRGWTAKRPFYFGAADTADSSVAESDSAAWSDSMTVAEADGLSGEDGIGGIGGIDESDELDELLNEIDRQIAADLDLPDLLAQFESIVEELQTIAGDFDALDRFFHQRMNEGRDAACGDVGLAYAYTQAEELAAEYAQELALLDEIAAQLQAAADAGMAGVDPILVGTLHTAAGTTGAAQGEFLTEMQSTLDLFACDEHELGELADQIADPDADPDQVEIGGYDGGTGGGTPPPGGGGHAPVLSNLSYASTSPAPDARFEAHFHFADPDGDLVSIRIGMTIWHDGEPNPMSYVLGLAGNPDFVCLLGTEADCVLPMVYSGLEGGDTYQFSFSVIDQLGLESNTLTGYVMIVGAATK
jgi:hypothetical protein